MSVVTADCPHCKAQHMTFNVFGVDAGPKVEYRASVAVAATCKTCSNPIVIHFRASERSCSSEEFFGISRILVQNNKSFDDNRFEVHAIWPQKSGPRVPLDLPAEVEKAFLQAERNVALPDCEEAAALMYRRALEIALKIAYPEMNGSLAARIRNLVAGHHLPAAIGDWLNQVRLIGNDSAHEIDGVTRDELEAARGFVDTALRYIFTLPAQIARLRGEPPAVA